MKPFDLRLLRSRAVWGIVVWGVLWALLQTAGIVLFAWNATAIIVAWFDGLAAQPSSYAGLLLGAALRAGAVWGSGVTASRGAARAKAELREQGMDALQRAGSTVLAGSSRSDTTLLFGRGLDALDDYFASYLPQLLLVLISTGLLWLVILGTDLASAVTIAIVLPLIPVFMVLIGLATRSVQDAQWGALQALGRQFLDLVDGLSTLKIFRRERAQTAGIEQSGNEYRRRTMKVLRLSFLSGFTLELAATLSVALVAVLIGTRLVAGELTLAVGLFVLLLVPDVFAPLRQVGASFHAAADGLTAADELFQLIEHANRPINRAAVVGNSTVVRELTVLRGGEEIVRGFTADFTAGQIHAIVGPSGAGKSTLLAGLLGFAESRGEHSISLARSAWVPQRPSLSAGTVAANIALGDGAPNTELVREALRQAAAETLDPDTMLGAGGSGLSGGQAQRVSVARALYRLARNPEVDTFILDEPSSALDGDTQQRLATELRSLADGGVTVILVSHRDGLVQLADSVWTVGGDA